MQVSKLYGTWKDQTCWIIGTGPSLRFFAPSFFDRKNTIGLNQSFRHVETTYNLTIHPELIPRSKAPHRRWITKRKGLAGTWHSKLTDADPNIWVLVNNKDVYDYSALETSDDTLYTGRGIQATAMCLAAKMGVTTAILVGCDMNQLGDDHHAHAQHVRFHGLDSKDVYDEYYECSVEVRERLRKLYGIRFYSLSPFLGMGREESEYKRFREIFNVEGFPVPKDTSSYPRRKDY